ncbi:hypothetical protein NKH75_33345, partial [Mesorhizobium sp. M0984]|uniref:hypothetical protein n=1 Tax=Mesorhizobium sp. M0984 TaxID=2957041 RepID=UPI003337232D
PEGPTTDVTNVLMDDEPFVASADPDLEFTCATHFWPFIDEDPEFDHAFEADRSNTRRQTGYRG